MRSNTPMRGIALVLAAAVLWGTTGTAQTFVPPSLPSYWIGALRLIAAALFFAALVLARGGLRLEGLSVRGVLIGGAAMAAFNLAFFAGVRATGVAVGTAVALGSGPIWAGLLQTLGGTRPAPRWWLGTALAVVGGVLMVTAGGRAGGALDALGVGLCLAAGLSYAAYALVNQRLVARAAPEAATTAVFVTAALIAVPAAWWIAGPASPGVRDLLIVGYLGVVATGIAYLLFSHALRHIDAATGVTLALAEPVTAFVLALLVVGERPSPAAMGGALLVLAGLAVVIWSESRR